MNVPFNGLIRKGFHIFQLVVFIPFYPLLVILTLLRPFCLIRIGFLYTSRIGHFSGNTELYCCEIDAAINKPKRNFKDVFFVKEKISNRQLLRMWQRKLTFLPSFLLYPLYFITYYYPAGNIHRVPPTTQHDRDVFNLFDRFPAHLTFTAEEEEKGRQNLLKMGVTDHKFICLNVRDSAFLSHSAYNYHSYRDCKIENFIYASEQLAKAGYTVIRMGAKVERQMASSHPIVIDYASNGMRSDFMDIYLGAKCLFAISTSSGWDGIPYIFRRPIAFVSFTPIGYFFSFSKRYKGIFKHHILEHENRELTYKEIFNSGLAYALTAQEFKQKGVILQEPSPTEIWELVSEMCEEIETPEVASKAASYPLQEILKSYYVEYSKNGPNGNILHGEFRATFGYNFLEANKSLLS